jgi:hypothetical protein
MTTLNEAAIRDALREAFPNSTKWRNDQITAVVWALIEASTTEEWGIEWDNLNGGSYIDTYSSKYSAETAYNASYSGALRTVRRRVTEWEDGH